MCGRFTLYDLSKFNININYEFKPNFNISPGSSILILNENKLPWPGFFIGQELKSNDYKLLSYEVLNNIYFLKISDVEMSVPYNSNFFIYENDNLTLLDSSLTI